MQGARIRYTPTTAPEMGTETKRNMEVLLEADPAKSAGQGFGSAGQYLDVCIKTDTDTWTVMDFGSSVRRPIPMRYPCI